MAGLAVPPKVSTERYEGWMEVSLRVSRIEKDDREKEEEMWSSSMRSTA